MHLQFIFVRQLSKVITAFYCVTLTEYIFNTGSNETVFPKARVMTVTKKEKKRNEILKMAIGVDTSKWKPRKIVGTPANKFRNILGVGVLTFGIISGLIFHFVPVTANLRKAVDGLYEDPIEEVERRLMIASGLPNRTGDAIRKYVEESKRPDLPDK